MTHHESFNCISAKTCLILLWFLVVLSEMLPVSLSLLVSVSSVHRLLTSQLQSLSVCVSVSVLDAVRNVTFVRLDDGVTSQVMTSSALYAGDELMCTSLGNPTPTYTVTTQLAITLALTRHRHTTSRLNRRQQNS